MTSGYNAEFEKLMESSNKNKFFIRESNSTFKIKLFIEKSKGTYALVDHLLKCKGVNVLFVNYWVITLSYYSMLYAAKSAILTKGYETDDHYATQVALGYLLVPDKIEKEDLELLEQSYKIFEDEYVEYFDDARKESGTARYSAIKKYSERRVSEIMENARKFIAKIEMMLQ
jgi:uncharacterized protein (UPF0332 family)